MSQRDTINGRTGAEAILSGIIELVAHMPSAKAFHARMAIMQINRMVVAQLFTPSDKPYHHRVLKVAHVCNQEAANAYDKYEKQVFDLAAETATDFYDAVMHHSNMEAPLPF